MVGGGWWLGGCLGGWAGLVAGGWLVAGWVRYLVSIYVSVYAWSVYVTAALVASACAAPDIIREHHTTTPFATRRPACFQ